MSEENKPLDPNPGKDIEDLTEPLSEEELEVVKDELKKEQS